TPAFTAPTGTPSAPSIALSSSTSPSRRTSTPSSASCWVSSMPPTSAYPVTSPPRSKQRPSWVCCLITATRETACASPRCCEAGLDRFLRALYSDCFDKEGIVLDVRFNGGGYTHEQVLSYLAGKEHTFFHQRDGGSGMALNSDDRRWTKPLVLLINNRTFSDAEIFPNAFRTMGLGKLVGQAT